MNQHTGEKKHLPGGAKQGKTRILVAPLDWGLGHATRCIPVIQELLHHHCEVWLAGEGAQEQLLKTEFPDLPFLDLSGYRIRYAKTKWGLVWKMLAQGPKMQRAIRHEQHWLKKMIEQYSFDAVISDNRYGLCHPSVPCFFITHQLAIKSSLGRWTENILQKRNYNYINRFTECWVPDKQEEPSFAGGLSHPEKKPVIPTRYIGLLSRFQKDATPVKKDHLLIILSGPEPQRSILENKIIADIGQYNHTATIVRGLPQSSYIIPSTNMIRFYNHLPATELNTAMAEAEYIISRSGYSSVMDIIALQKKSILIPTPGQTEQEYLGHYLQQKKVAVAIKQTAFSLPAALQTAKEFPYQLSASENNGDLQNAVAGLLSLINKQR